MENEDTGAVVVVEPTMEEVAGGGTPEAISAPIEVAATPEVSPTLEPITEEATEKSNVDKRIGKITAEKYGFKREAESLRTELDQLKANQGKPQLPEDAPKLEDFDYDDVKHQEAVIEYQVKKALETQQNVTITQQSEQARQKVADDFTTKEGEYLAKHPEYAEEVSGLPRFNQDTLEAIYELGPQVTHYLAKNLDVANEVASASPTMAAVKLGQISMGLTADTKVVTPSTAPEPVERISGAASVSKSMDEMSMDEIMAL